jgi:hypothetical protein
MNQNAQVSLTSTLSPYRLHYMERQILIRMLLNEQEIREKRVHPMK